MGINEESSVSNNKAHGEISQGVSPLQQESAPVQTSEIAKNEQVDFGEQAAFDTEQNSKAERLHIVLASQSPRRKELLEQAGVRFMVHASEVDETLTEDEQAQPYEAAAILAERKAAVVVQELLAQKPQGVWVIIGADTIVTLDGRIFGKPRNISQATNMLRCLSGRTHQVMTGVSVWMVNANDPEGVSVGRRTFTDVSEVSFKELSDEDISEYLKRGESFDKAGAYAVQGFGAQLISKVEGSVDTVIGLPVGRLLTEFPDLREI